MVRNLNRHWVLQLPDILFHLKKSLAWIIYVEWCASKTCFWFLRLMACRVLDHHQHLMSSSLEVEQTGRKQSFCSSQLWQSKGEEKRPEFYQHHLCLPLVSCQYGCSKDGLQRRADMRGINVVQEGDDIRRGGGDIRTHVWHVRVGLVSVQDVGNDSRDQQNKTGSTTKQNQLNSDTGWIISTVRKHWNTGTASCFLWGLKAHLPLETQVRNHEVAYDRSVQTVFLF